MVVLKSKGNSYFNNNVGTVKTTFIGVVLKKIVAFLYGKIKVNITINHLERVISRAIKITINCVGVLT